MSLPQWLEDFLDSDFDDVEDDLTDLVDDNPLGDPFLMSAEELAEWEAECDKLMID